MTDPSDRNVGAFERALSADLRRAWHIARNFQSTDDPRKLADAVEIVISELLVLAERATGWDAALQSGWDAALQYPPSAEPSDCDFSLGVHGCVRPAGHAPPHACDEECDLGHLREDQLRELEPGAASLAALLRQEVGEATKESAQLIGEAVYIMRDAASTVDRALEILRELQAALVWPIAKAKADKASGPNSDEPATS